ncbi:MAG: IS630 family transposase [Arachnia propionica]|uniref:IS630 family transposase n=1 Tax=Arachnia propionica TaxID=1750 RepID=UPI0026FFBA07|nr:IS630 family transposase [Arachnia propionica]
MDDVVISGDEFRILQDCKRGGPHKLMQAKAEAILLLSRRVDVETVAEMAERQVSTILSWVRDWHATRLASIHTGHAGNLNASKLTAQQRAEVVEVLQRPPGDEGLPVEFWSVPDLAGWIDSRFQVTHASDTSYHFLLHLAGLSFHKPEAIDQRRAPQAEITARMAQIRHDLATCWAGDDVLIVSADEVRIEHETILRRAWYTRGAKTTLKVNRITQTQSYIGFLHETDGSVDLIALDWQDSDNIVNALTELTLTYPTKRIVIVWDNATWHTSKHLRSHLGEGNPLENIHLINLPPYAPDHNPIEHVWNEAKNHISNQQRASFTETRHAFETYITNNKFPYRITKDLV